MSFDDTSETPPFEDLLTEGSFGDALDLIDTPDAPDDVASLRLRFCLQARVQSYDRADATLAKLVQRDSQQAALYEGFRQCIPAQRFAAERLTDPELAIKRISLMPAAEDEYGRVAVFHARGQHQHAAAELEKLAATSRRRRRDGQIIYLDGTQSTFYTIEDVDPMTGTTLPCYRGGQVLDVPYRQLRSVALSHEPTLRLSPWIPAEVSTIDGTRHSVFLPVEYPATTETEARERPWQTSKHAHGYEIWSCARRISIRYQVNENIQGGSNGELRFISRIDFDPDPEPAPPPSRLKGLRRWFSS